MQLSSSLIFTFSLLLGSSLTSATVLDQPHRPNFKRDACIPVPGGPCQPGWAPECGYYGNNVVSQSVDDPDAKTFDLETRDRCADCCLLRRSSAVTVVGIGKSSKRARPTACGVTVSVRLNVQYVRPTQNVSTEHAGSKRSRIRVSSAS